MLSYFGLAVSLWPYIVPRALTFWDAASPPATQAFILIVFRHKVSAEEHY